MGEPVWKDGKKFCACGKRINRYASQCRSCHEAAQIEHAKKYLTVEAKGTCPDCGEKLLPNNTLAGSLWLQCLSEKDGKRCHYQIIADKDKVCDLKM